MLGQKPIKLIGKSLFITGTEGWRPAGIDTTSAKFIQHIAHRKTFLNVILCVKFTAWIKGMARFVDGGCGQGDVGGDHQISGL